MTSQSSLILRLESLSSRRENALGQGSLAAGTGLEPAPRLMMDF